jgi:hypothetical protein
LPAGSAATGSGSGSDWRASHAIASPDSGMPAAPVVRRSFPPKPAPPASYSSPSRLTERTGCPTRWVLSPPSRCCGRPPLVPASLRCTMTRRGAVSVPMISSELNKPEHGLGLGENVIAAETRVRIPLEPPAQLHRAFRPQSFVPLRGGLYPLWPRCDGAAGRFDCGWGLIEHPHDFLQVLTGELRVDRRGLDVEVPEVFLDGPQVSVGAAE